MSQKSPLIRIIFLAVILVAVPSSALCACTLGALPFGSLDMPVNNSQVAGGINVSGWALS